MLSSEASTIHYLAPHAQNPSSPLPFDYTFMHKNLPSFQFNTFLTNNSNNNNNNIPNYPIQDFMSTNSTTSDESEEQQHRVIDERKQRRMISNRESARRSRMRKQRHLDELWSHVLRLRTENHNLIIKLNQVSESHEKIVQENMQLKDEASDLRRLLTDIQLIDSPNLDGFSELYDIPCSLKAESSNQSNT